MAWMQLKAKKNVVFFECVVIDTLFKLGQLFTVTTLRSKFCQAKQTARWTISRTCPLILVSFSLTSLVKVTVFKESMNSELPPKLLENSAQFCKFLSYCAVIDALSNSLFSYWPKMLLLSYVVSRAM